MQLHWMLCPKGSPKFLGMLQARAAHKAAFESAVRAEFARIMAVGKNTANEAAVLAVAAARQNLSR